jgi:hypothetical protein
MKSLLLVSALGLTLLANTAVAAVSVEDSAVWRTEANTIENVDKEANKSTKWTKTQFSPVDNSKKKETASKIWRHAIKI